MDTRILKKAYMKRNCKIDKNALVAYKTEVFNLRGSQTKTFFPQ